MNIDLFSISRKIKFSLVSLSISIMIFNVKFNLMTCKSSQ